MEHIHLTNSKLLGELTFDKSDSFYWLTQQARRGVATAQVNLFEQILRLILEKKMFFVASFR